MNLARQKVEPFYTRLNIQNTKVQRKTEELVRILDVRAPTGIHPSGNTCRYAACLHLACKIYGENFDRTAIVQICGVDSISYRDAYATVAGILQINPQITFEQLGIQLGHPELSSVSKKILSKYKERFVKSLPEIQKQHAKFDSPAYLSAPFVLAAEFREVKIDRKFLLDITETRQKEFKQVYDSMDELVMQPIKQEMEKSKTQKRKKVKSQKKTQIEQEETTPEEKNPNTTIPKEDHKKKEKKPKSELNVLTLVYPQEVTENEIELDIEEFAHGEVGEEPALPKALRERKRRREYEEWKERAVTQDKVVIGNTKQTSLDSFVKPTKKQKTLEEKQHSPVI